jgi:hypothetical protein
MKLRGALQRIAGRHAQLIPAVRHVFLELRKGFVNQQKVDELLLALRGESCENAICALREMGSAVVPALRTEFAHADEPRVRQAIVEIINQFRRGEDLPFFAEALLDSDERVWQAAIDALVSQPGQESLRLAQSVLKHVEAERYPKERKLLFLSEAVAELRQPSPFAVGEKGVNNV